MNNIDKEQHNEFVKILDELIETITLMKKRKRLYTCSK